MTRALLLQRRDSPPAHRPSYFQVDPCARSDPKDRFLQCVTGTPPPTAEPPQNIRTELREVGDIGSFAVYDLVYFNGEDTGETKPVQLRSVLVKVGPDSFREVHVQEALGAVLPTEIMQVGQQRLIEVKPEDGGMYHIVYEDYFILTSGGLQHLDFGPVIAAAERLFRRTNLPTSHSLIHPS
jgi:hypothetical protein